MYIYNYIQIYVYILIWPARLPTSHRVKITRLSHEALPVL